MAENYIAENNLGGTREQQVAAAAKGLENLAARGGDNIRNEFNQQSGAAISNFKNQGTSTSNVVNNSAKDAIVEQDANRRMGVNPSSYMIQDASKSGNELAKEAQGLFDAMSKK